MHTAPEVLLQLTPGSHVITTVLVSRARDVGTGALIVEMHLERVSRHQLIAVGVVGAHHSQLVEKVAHQRAGATHVRVSKQRLSVCGTRFLHAHVSSQAHLTEGVRTRSVYGINERLLTHLTEQVLVYIIRIVVEVISARLVSLAARFTDYYVAHTSDFETTSLFDARHSTNV